MIVKSAPLDNPVIAQKIDLVRLPHLLRAYGQSKGKSSKADPYMVDCKVVASATKYSEAKQTQ